MSGLSAYSANNLLNYIVGKTAMPTLPTAYIALFTATGLDDGTGFTEVAGNNYSRIATAGTDWNSAAEVEEAEAPSTISNAHDISFPTPSGAWGTILAFGLYDASSAGNLLFWDYLGAFAWQPVTISSASPAVFTEHAHGYANGDNVVFSTEYDGVAPTLAGGSGLLTTIPLTVANVTTDTYTLATGVLAINTTTTGNGSIRKVNLFTVNQFSGVVTFAASNLVLSAA